jgi:hypothetical protein
MATGVFSFVWHVPAAGFKWVRARVVREDGEEFEDKERWVLTDDVAVGRPYGARQYQPLKAETGLYRTFAFVSADDREAILSFANEYGNLGVGGRVMDLTESDDPARRLGVLGEPFEVWRTAIAEMRRAVALWDMTKAGDVAGLRRILRWQAAEKDAMGLGMEEGWCYRAPDGRGAFVRQERGLFKPGDVLTPASFLVQQWVNDNLRGRASPMLVYDLDLGRQVAQVVPHDLLTAMWLQFWQGIGGNKDYHSCKECGRWFELSSDQSAHRTVRREFCSDPCKSRDYRRRKDRARQLKAEGKSVKEIARETDTDLDTIKKWVTKRKG